MHQEKDRRATGMLGFEGAQNDESLHVGRSRVFEMGTGRQGGRVCGQRAAGQSGRRVAGRRASTLADWGLIDSKYLPLGRQAG